MKKWSRANIDSGLKDKYSVSDTVEEDSSAVTVH